ncbi:MAG TPA: hypothetical protein VM076_19970 [Gemmatimonadaceae bacterium]|nr:hypothetical protein [Gemmatimonadaceae bacterium]
MRLSTLLSSASLLLQSACGGGDDGGTGPGGQTPTIPPARSGHAMVFDDARRVTLMFGGSGASTLGDLWSWDGTRWTRLSTSGPSARDDAVLVYDATRQRTVLFGGRSGQTLLNDTWEWDGATWTQKAGTAPEARLHAIGAFDAARGVVRMYGGVGADDVPRTDTWEWNGTTWTRASTTGPANRGGDHMAYDRGRQRTMALLFQRTAPNADQTYPTDLWEWTGTAWAAVPGTGPSFSPIQPMVALGASGGLLVFDGGVLQGTASTWVWQNATWTRAATTSPALRNGHAMAYDLTRGKVVLFGGFRSGQDFSDTWEWDGTRWAQATPQ